MNRLIPPTPRDSQPSGKPLPMVGVSEDALIARGVGKWGDPTFPKTDWVCDSVTDKGEPDVTCEMCEYKIIRYVHHLRHPSGLGLMAGCICAGHLTGDLDAAKARDQDAKNAATRLANRRRTHDREWVKFDKIKTTGPSALKALGGIRDRAISLARKASIDSDISSGHFVLEVDADCLAYQAGEAITRIQKSLPAYRLQQALADPDWRETPKGWRFEASWDDVVQVYERDGGWRFGLQVRGGPMKWPNTTYASARTARAAGVEALKRTLRKAGRLPRSGR